MTSLAAELAAQLGGGVTHDHVLVNGDLIECRPSGAVILNRAWQLGTFSDGADLLAARYRTVRGAA